jgi:hypothetical protein
VALILADTHVSRFWARVLRVENPVACWLWSGSLNHGYGRLSVGPRQTRYEWRATHLSWMLATGHRPDVDAGEFICHTCDNPRCVRNDDIGTYAVDGTSYERRGHLYLAGVVANNRDCAIKQRSARGDRNGSRLHPEKLTRGDVRSAQMRGRAAAGADHYLRRAPERIRRGTQCYQTRLTEADVREIRRRYAAGGVTYQALATEYRMSPQVVGFIVRRETWRHVLP